MTLRLLGYALPFYGFCSIVRLSTAHESDPTLHESDPTLHENDPTLGRYMFYFVLWVKQEVPAVESRWVLETLLPFKGYGVC